MTEQFGNQAQMELGVSGKSHQHKGINTISGNWIWDVHCGPPAGRLIVFYDWHTLFKAEFT
jgi:hypothetical protein